MGFYDDMGVKQMADMEGIKDLPIQVKSKFIQALKAESQGDFQKAESFLNEAVAKEQEAKEASKK